MGTCSGNITRTTLQWNSGHQKASAREADPRTPGDRKLAQNRQEWRTFVAAFHASGHCGR